MEINETVARRVLQVIDAGLVKGVGVPEPGKLCVEAAVCYALGLPHGDDPGCVSQALRALKIRLNDSNWSSDKARANGLRRLGLAQLGSAGVIDDKEFARRVAKLAISKQVPAALRAAASVNPKHSVNLLRAAEKCEKQQDRASAIEARDAATAADYDATAAATAADYAANAATATAYAAATATAYAAATAAAYAANAADYDAANADARDKSLAQFAEDVVQILIEMKAPGCQWLTLTEAADDEKNDPDYDPTPYCSYGHATKAQCDCGPIAENE